MKRIVLVVLAMAMCIGANGQEKKKGGGLWGKIKKGVESTTGLDVSKETVFVYPTIGDWKMSLVSCEGNAETGAVVIKINAIQLTDGRLTRGVRVKSVCPAGTTDELKLFYHLKYYDFPVGKATELTLTHAENVPVEVKMLDAKIIIENAGNNPSELIFEARDIPVEWK